MQTIPLLGVLLVLCVSSLATAAEGPVLLRWNFEGDSPFNNLSIEGEPPVVIQDPLQPGNRVMHAVLKPNAARPERSEVRFDRIDVGQERWVGCRIYRPDPEQFYRVCTFQLGPIWGAPDRNGRGLYQILAWKQPEGHTWSFRGYMSRVDQPDFDEPAGSQVIGAWENWVMYLKLRSDAQGEITLWRNGRKIFHRVGQNAWPGDRIAVKWGAYVGSKNSPQQETHIYYDDIVIADETATYRDVAPGGGSPLPEK